MPYKTFKLSDGSRVWWSDYMPDSFCPVLADGETWTMPDGSTATRKGDRVKWAEPAWLLKRMEAKHSLSRAELEAEVAQAL